MRITENFAMAVQPRYMHVTVPGGKGYHSWYATRRDIRITLADEPAVHVRTEREGWVHLASCPKGRDFLDLLARDDELYRRGLALRADLMLRLSETEFEALETAFYARMKDMQAVILRHLDAHVRNKKAEPNRVKHCRAVSQYELRNSAIVPHMDERKNTKVYVRYFPSPIDDNAWDIRVRMEPKGPEVFAENHHRITRAFDELRSRGITVGDVLQGTWLDYS